MGETAGADAGSAALADSEMSWPVVSSTRMYDGPVIAVDRDTLREPDGSTFERDVVVDLGAVAVLALDDQGQVLVVEQYRHPARRRLVELPAGLLDNPGEDPEDAARRELAEEGHLIANRWSRLLTLMPSPGISDETMTVFLAEAVEPVDPPVGFTAVHEEASMTRNWAPLDEIVDAVLTGRVTNATLAAGALAAWVLRHRGRP
jgi:8-oxo-dGDP phosphatase